MILKYNERFRLPNIWILEGPDGAGKSSLAEMIGSEEKFKARPSINTPEGYNYDLEKLNSDKLALDRFYLISGIIYLHVQRNASVLTVSDIYEAFFTGWAKAWYLQAWDKFNLRKEELRFCFLLPSFSARERIQPKKYKTSEMMQWLRANASLLRLSYWVYAGFLAAHGFETFILCDEKPDTTPNCFKQAYADTLKEGK